MKIEAKNPNPNLIKLGGFFIHKTAFRLSSYEETLEIAKSHNMQLLTEEAFNALLKLPYKTSEHHLLIAESLEDLDIPDKRLILPPTGFRWLDSSIVHDDTGFYRFGDGDKCFTFSNKRELRVQAAAYDVELSFLLMNKL